MLASLTLITIIRNVTYDFYFYNRGNFEIKGGDIIWCSPTPGRRFA